MQKGRLYYRPERERRSSFSARTALSAFVLCAVGSSLLYFNFTPDVRGSVQFSYSVPPIVENSEPVATSQSNEEEPVWREDTQPASGSSQEIADVTGPDESIFALMYANLLDEIAARKVAISLANAVGGTMGKGFDAYSPLKPGARYTITVDKRGNFQKVVLELDPARVFHCEAIGETFSAWKEDVVLDFKVETIGLKVDGTLTQTVLKAGEGMELARELINAFQWDIDFQAESLRGDTCSVLFERRYADDRPSGYGKILAAVYDGRKTGRKTAVLFNGQYWSEEGIQLERNFLRSPLKTIRVTSRFGRRIHPISRELHQHWGVDYGAPTGTPIMAVAKGIVTFAGWDDHGYGNYVCIKHDNGRESRYGHLSRILVQKGARVKQGQRIGLVGQTGRATGPHLDFQLLVGGKHVDPLKFKYVQNLKAVPDPLKQRFKQIASEGISPLDGRALSMTSRRAGW